MNERPRSLIQIVPSLSPVIDGIGDYALQLARQLRQTCGVETSFIVCDPAWPRHQWSGEFQAVGLGRRTPSLLWASMYLLALRTGEVKSPILLHFSPYGYQKRGCPFWLVHGLETLAKRSSMRVNVAFHELDVDSSKPWSSSYWVPRVQRDLIKRLLNLAAFSYTNTGVHRSKLEAWGGEQVALVPNFSNMGEAEDGTTEQRARQVVIFGRADQRRWTYEKGARALALLCKSIGATRIIDIGSAIPEHTSTEIHGIPIERRGVLPSTAIAAAMRSALANFMYYPIPLLTKSGVHALACASGAVSFIATDGEPSESCPGLTAGLDYFEVTNEDSIPSLADLERLAPAIHQSYRKRSSEVAASIIADGLYRQSDARSTSAFPGGEQQWALSRRKPLEQVSAFGANIANQEVGL